MDAANFHGQNAWTKELQHSKQNLSKGNTYSFHVSLEDGAMANHVTNDNTVCSNDGENIGSSLDDLGTYEVICM